MRARVVIVLETETCGGKASVVERLQRLNSEVVQQPCAVLNVLYGL